MADAPGMRPSRTAAPPLKHFKARIENPIPDIFAIEVWFKAPNIIEAGATLLSTLAIVTSDNVTQLIEVDKDR